MLRMILLMPVLAVAACSAGAQEGERVAARGEAGSRTFEVGDFDAVELAGPHDVIVRVGGAPSVRAEGDAEALEELEVRMDGSTLEVGTRRRGGMGIGFRKSRAARIYVTVPALRAAGVAGSGNLRIDRVEGESFDGSLAGSGELIVDALRVGRAEFSVAGSGDIRAAGAAEAVEVGIAGSGDVDLSGLQVRTADVNVMGSGDVRLNATDTADVSIMGSGDVAVTGGARCSVSKSGSGDVTCG